MQFYIDSDRGYSIVGWMVPDNPSDDVEIVISVPGRNDQTLRANVLRSDVVQLGMHPTGMVGFQIDESIIPDIETIPVLFISDPTSGLKLYGRYDANVHIRNKSIFLTAGGMPQFKFLRQAMAHYALSYPIVERFGLETTLSIMSNVTTPSISIFGQLNWMRFGGSALEHNFQIFALLRSPFEELAERLLFLKFLRNRSVQGTDDLIMDRNKPLIPLLDALETPNPRTLLNAFRRLTPEQRRLIRSPMTSMLACTPDEEPQRKSVSLALEHLSHFTAVGVKAHFQDYARIVDGIIGKSVMSNSQIESLPNTDELALKLSEMGIVLDLLDEDIALYSFGLESVVAGNKVELELPEADLAQRGMR